MSDTEKRLQAEIGALSLFNALGQKLVKRILDAPAEGDNKDDVELRLMAIIAERDALKASKVVAVRALNGIANLRGSIRAWAINNKIPGWQSEDELFSACESAVKQCVEQKVQSSC